MCSLHACCVRSSGTLLHTICTLLNTLAHAAWADAFPDL
jgi:hypothetical protein